MKRIMTLTLSLLLCLPASAQSSSMLAPSRVERNVELMSVVWRLVGAGEYGFTNFKLYTDKIEERFTEYKDHELIGFARSIRAENGIGYDAVMSMAVHLDKELNLRTDVAAGSLERRWKDVDKEHFVSLLKKFAADTRFDEFYAGNAELYAEASGRFMSVYESVDLDWYTKFFGTEMNGKFIIINGLGLGTSNYGVSAKLTDGTEEIYAVVGAWSVDEAGMVVFPPDNYLPILLHEFNHSFINGLNAKHSEAFRDSGERLWAVYGEVMRRQAYANWEIMLNEALVRAAVIKYMKDHGATQEQFASMVRNENRNGFQWVGAIVMELDNYSGTRNEYPTFDDYMPRLAEAYGPWVKQIEDAMAARIAAQGAR